MFFSGLEQGDPAEKREKNACNIRLFLKVSSIFYPDNTFILPPTVRHDACTMGQKCKKNASSFKFISQIKIKVHSDIAPCLN